jgi:SAM-dependent methyltransferase
LPFKATVGRGVLAYSQSDTGRRTMQHIKNAVRRMPILRSLAKVVYFTLLSFISSSGSEAFWRRRYRWGGTSGAGSYNEFAEFKAGFLNGFVRDRQIRSIIEFGCGDGNQLRLSVYPLYLGFDVSPEAIAQCQNLFRNDETKTFKLVGAYANESAELTLSLDVIYHLYDDIAFLTYMKLLFDSSTRFVIIYSSNTDEQARLQAPHVRHRKFSKWIEQNGPEWNIVQHIPNKYPYADAEQQGTFSDFYVYEKALG